MLRLPTRQAWVSTTLSPVSVSRGKHLTCTHQIPAAFLVVAYAHTNNPVSYRGSGHRPFTNVVFSLPHRTSGCDSGYALGGGGLANHSLGDRCPLHPFSTLLPPEAFYTFYLSHPGSFYLLGLSISGEALAEALPQAHPQL